MINLAGPEPLKYMKRIIITMAFVGCSSCASLYQKPVSPPSNYDSSVKTMETEKKWVQFPEAGKLSVARLGDSLIYNNKTFGNNEIFLKNSLLITYDSPKAIEMLNICKITVLPAGRYLAWMESSSKKYFAHLANQADLVADVSKASLTNFQCQTGGNYGVSGFVKDKATGELRPWVFRFWNELGPVLKPDDYKESFNIVVQDANFKQELSYSGRSNNQIKFLYREYAGSLLRSNFSQELIYDLSSGSEVGFKGAKLKIISANNTEIKYTVLNHFDPIE